MSTDLIDRSRNRPTTVHAVDDEQSTGSQHSKVVVTRTRRPHPCPNSPTVHIRAGLLPTTHLVAPNLQMYLKCLGFRCTLLRSVFHRQAKPYFGKYPSVPPRNGWEARLHL